MTAVAVVAALLVGVAGVDRAGAASSAVTVTLTVPTATSLDASGCSSDVAGVTDLGIVLPSSSVFSSTPCVVRFGSSNGVGRLRLGQQDQLGSAMYLPSAGAPDLGYDGPSGTGNGVVTTPVGSNHSTTDTCDSAAVQADGKLVCAGDMSYGDYLLTRFMPDGILDATFDGPTGVGNGMVRLDLGGSTEVAEAMVIQPDGRIVAVGRWGTRAGVVRVNQDGTWDTTFDGDGRVSLAISGGDDVARTVALQPDGKIIVAGGWTGAPDSQPWAARLNRDGSLDTAFDGPSGTGNGIVVLAGPSGNDYVTSALIDSAGDIVLAATWSGTNIDVAVIRLKSSDGTLDTTLDGPSGTGNGIVTFGIGTGSDSWPRIARQPDDKLVVAARSANATLDVGLARINADGTFDASFDGPSGTGNGRFTVAVGTGTDTVDGGVVVQPDGRIVVGGRYAGDGQDAFIMRMNPDGSLDETFDGPSGSADGLVRISEPGDDMPQQPLLGVDGDLLLAGQAGPMTALDIRIRAFDGLGVPNYDGGASTFTSNAFGVCLAGVGAGTTGTWAVPGGCPTSNATQWRAVPASVTSPGAEVATSDTSTTTARVDLMFGFRASSNQSRGRYVAPLVFDVVAP